MILRSKKLDESSTFAFKTLFYWLVLAFGEFLTLKFRPEDSFYIASIVIILCAPTLVTFLIRHLSYKKPEIIFIVPTIFSLFTIQLLVPRFWQEFVIGGGGEPFLILLLIPISFTLIPGVFYLFKTSFQIYRDMKKVH